MFQLRYLIYFSVFTALFYNVQTQLVNLAYKKTAIQSGTHGGYVANKAVDGTIIQRLGYCSHTNWNLKPVWWQVDLSNIYGIESIKIYHRNDTNYRLNGFQIIVSTDGKLENKQPCYKDPIEQNEKHQPSIVTVKSCKGPARYVNISNDKWYDEIGPLLELCEVEIYGCPQNKYGENCTSDCHCKQKGCFYENGSCFIPGCEAGWHGTSCNKECSANKFGANCTFTCHCHDGSCNRSTGFCHTPGCKAGWKGDNCSTSCDINKKEFGFDCNSTCKCRNGSCNRKTGNCDVPGCEAGWKSNSCSTTCDSNLNEFGMDCNSTCHCLTGSCDRTTGYCVTHKCKDGWQGSTCSSPCMLNKFGFACNSTCHCKEGSCDNTDGKCFKSGCKPGWKGKTCSNQCDDNIFGQNCKDTCYCLNGTCDKITGVCDIPGCKPGYQKKSCSVECDNGTFGSNCGNKCHCLVGTCNNENGICGILGCQEGWQGSTCSEECDNGTFGSNCANKCHCLVGTCNNENGICGILGCKEGWQGSTCSEDLNSTSLPVIVGTLVASLSFISVAVLILIYIFRRKRSSKGTKDVDESHAKPDDTYDHVYHELDLSENTEYAIIQAEDNKERTYVNDHFDKTILRMDKITDEVTEKIKNGILQEQLKSIPSGPLHPQTAGMLSKNKNKNKNQNILPYDHSRVILDTSDQDPDDDYINASYVNVLIKDSTYIATQGPMKNTVEDFWRMIWQTKSSVIVMLTNVIENNQVTCFQYWPVSSSVLGIPGYEITLIEEQMRSEFKLRKLKVKNIKTGEVRKVCLLQFTSWPKQSVPHPYQLFLLHQEYTEIISTNNSGPAIIHCSDGTDRTGVFIAFDAISQCCYRNEIIDIYKLVTDMRQNRINMVATEECYVFLHKLFLEYLLLQDINTTKHHFRTAIKEEGNNIEREYEVLINNLPEYDDTFYKEAMLKKNRGKNRNNCILPVETYLLILRKAGAAHYINAISVPSCRMSRQFLVTQIPFANTVVDLWKMISEYKSCTVVNLEDAPGFEKDLIWYPSKKNKPDLGKLNLTKTSESMAIPETKDIYLNLMEKQR